ncbi:hypothetical protein JOF56_001285 [Kibdelosporangium banguiense]|uniref:Uncharacterized protein n=1 Tax=Kibdelosporangium banguiense TaxID=1365924 RepID=A0ABS4T9X2_9PSEU|nr:hypothetical protein [Kibdelosporangium banguiense]MBP2320900.1 hypothetical protein [Kibdelosporangium banguiense]
MRRSISVAVLAALVGAAVTTPAAAQPPTETPATEPKTVTLITGDRVTVAQRGGKWDVQVEAAGAEHGFLKHSGPNGVTVIPMAVAPLVRSGKLDRALFDVTGLIKQGYDDARTPEIRLLVESSGAKALGKVTRELGGLPLSRC